MYMQLNNIIKSVIVWLNIEKTLGAEKIHTRYFILSWFVT